MSQLIAERGDYFEKKVMSPKERSYSVFVCAGERVVAYEQMFLNRATMISVYWLMFFLQVKSMNCDSHYKINRYVYG